MAATTEPILEVGGLVKHYPLTRGVLFKKQTGAVRGWPLFRPVVVSRSTGARPTLFIRRP